MSTKNLPAGVLETETPETPEIPAASAAALAPAGTARLPVRQRAVFALLFLASGACLLVYIFSGVSLLAAVAVAAVVVTAAGTLRWRRLSTAARVALTRRLRVGLISGLFATAAYDGFRYLIIELLGISFWPFDVFSLFGQALVGAGSTGPWVTAAGVAFHVTNGVSFAMAYTIMFGHRGIRGGIAWAFVLEVLMVSVYPGWLDLKALDEFLQVSVLGHAVYGGVLGYLSRRLLAPERAGAG